jgi:hypothetical protein
VGPAVRPPEPFASAVDEITAGQLVELAIHAHGGSEASRRLAEAADWVQHASDYFAVGVREGGAYSSEYAHLRRLADSAVKGLKDLSGRALGLEGADLKAFQAGPVYDFQGELGYLFVRTHLLLVSYFAT